MTRTAFALLALASLATAAPVPKQPPTFPTAVGTRWEYVRAGNEKKTWTEEVTERTEQDGQVTFKVEVTTTLGFKQWEKYKVADGQLLHVADMYSTYDPPPVLRDTAWKAGDSWTRKFKLDGGEYEEAVSVGDPEEVATPAGKFTAVPVTRTPVKPVKGNGSTCWYADGVGLVRVCEVGATTPLMELKAFTPGKK